jgi:hypothetical protein
VSAFRSLYKDTKCCHKVKHFIPSFKKNYQIGNRLFKIAYKVEI